MFEKKDIIFSSTMGLCIVADVTKLSPDKSAPVMYYVLRAYYDRNKTAYIPVENHEVELRERISVEEAKAYVDELREEYLHDQEYIPDDRKVGEAAFVMGLSIDDFLELSGAPSKNEEEE